ncbi:MAG: hypothetical protein V1872_07805 [bacterium]
MKSTSIFWIVFLGIIFFLSYKLIPPYAKFIYLKQEVDDLLKRQKKNKELISQKVLELATDVKIDLTNNNVSFIKENDGGVTLEIKYTKEVNLLLTNHPLKFIIRRSLGPLKNSSKHLLLKPRKQVGLFIPTICKI